MFKLYSYKEKCNLEKEGFHFVVVVDNNNFILGYRMIDRR